MDNKEQKHINDNLETECYGEALAHITEMNAMYWQWKSEQEQKDLEEMMQNDSFEVPRIEENKPKILQTLWARSHFMMSYGSSVRRKVM